jgi:UDP-glucuronate 4-epimerase
MQTILITGGAGFIGSHLAERLLADGHAVVAFDNFDPFYDPQIKRRNIRAALASPSYRLVEGDIRDRGALDAVLASARFDAIVHLAARAGVRPSIERPELYADVNLLGSARVLESARVHRVARFLFGSSSSVYGNNPKVPFAESDPVDHPVSPYAATKKGGELLAHTYHAVFGMDVACLRFFTVYGPRQRPEMAIHKFARRLLAGQEIERFGTGSTSRDYTYISDIVEGVVRALDRCEGYHVWNLGGSRTHDLDGLVIKIAERLGVVPKIRPMPSQPGDVERTWADIRRARDDLGWEPRVDLDEGLDSFLTWLRAETARQAIEGDQG